jgi:hypothetical protein
MIAHVAGAPLEELLLPLLASAGALSAGLGALLSRRRRRIDKVGQEGRSLP